ncbi:MAG: hypothetical protein LUB63_00955, partial [Oscillospiraceae bacterium]|nr:hypothetical protein [Oscillospiraceae bacterium]
MEIKVNKTVVKAILIMAAVVVLIGAALFALQQWEDWQQSQNSTLQDSASQDELYTDDQALTYYNGAWYALRDDIETMLVLGVDKFESDDQTESYTNHQQADFLLLLILDHKLQSSTTQQQNPDTITHI